MADSDYQFSLMDLSTLQMGDATMNASELIDDLIANLTDWRGITLAKLRRIIREADPEIIEEWKWMGTPVWSHDGIVCLAKAFKDKVKVTFPHGASLSDPDQVFNAELTGKQWRAIYIYKDDRINEGSLKILIHAALDYNLAGVKTASKPGGTRGTVKKKPAN
jgi:hypothetical protein